MTKQKVILLILDGWGIGKISKVDAIHQAKTPFYDSLRVLHPHATLVTYGEEVGLPKGQMGNSEVGHMNIGAGRIVYQDLAKINKAIREGELAKNPELLSAIKKAKESGSKLHVMGLLSDGGVHSHIDHLKAICDIIEDNEVDQSFVHAFLDGRDTAPDGGVGYLADLLSHIEKQKIRLSTVIGRYYAMDRDTRWERTKKAYDLLVHGHGEYTTDDPLTKIKELYAAEEAGSETGAKDEFMPGIKVTAQEGNIADGDVVIFINFRSDRPRQITEVLTQKDHPDHDMSKLDLHFTSMTRYDEKFDNVHVMFDKDNLNQTIGEIISKVGRTQLRIAETEKYPHVTFFFNGGQEQPFPGEDRVVVPSPKVATYDLQPEMSADKITEEVIKKMINDGPDFICLNFANTDMVGHTGDFGAAQVAAQTVDGCMSQIVKLAIDLRYDTLVIADHGNSDFMMNEDGSPHTAHTTNPVPVIYIPATGKKHTIMDGKLADVAPTILHLMNVEIPEEMTGNVLVSKVEA